MLESRLRVRHLTTSFRTERGVLRAIDDVSFDVPEARTVALVGESGCGKSVTALSVLRLIPTPSGRIERGEVWFGNQNLIELPERDLRRVRGAGIAMIFQEPMTSLNPVYCVGSQIVEVLRIHGLARGRRARARAIELLELVGIPSPSDRVHAFPHQLSGGMRQRVMIAMALAGNPSLLIADEPTTALDVTIQAQILDLMQHLQEELRMSILFITHDLGVVAEFAHEVIVMYAGRIVEQGTVHQIFADPRHPYTRGLLASVPPLGSSRGGVRPRRLTTIGGIVPNLIDPPSGCRFAGRCPLLAQRPELGDRCVGEEPGLVGTDGSHTARCHFAEERES